MDVYTTVAPSIIMKEKAMMERRNSDVSTPKRLGDYLLPLQVALLMLSGVFVMQMSSSTSLEALERRLSATPPPPRRLRQTYTAVTSHLQHYKKRAIIEDLQKLYEGSTLDKEFVKALLRDGKELLSQIDTIYNISLPTIGLEEDAEASKKGITVRRQ